MMGLTSALRDGGLIGIDRPRKGISAWGERRFRAHGPLPLPFCCLLQLGSRLRWTSSRWSSSNRLLLDPLRQTTEALGDETARRLLILEGILTVELMSGWRRS